MATQIFELGIYQPGEKDILTKEEALAFCANFNQKGGEVNDFFATHDFDRWRCVGMDVYDQYSSNNDPDAFFDCSPPSLLGILITSMNSDAPEQALRKYSRPDTDIRFPYREDWDLQLNHFPTCPLWICQIKSWSQYAINAVVLIPDIFWGEDGPDYDSYGYPYTVKYPGRHDMWYWGDYDQKYYNQRMGAYSPNVLDTDGRAIQRNSESLYYDPEQHRFFLIGWYGKGGRYIDLKGDLEAKEIELDELKGMHIKEDVYRMYTKKGVIVTDKNFNQLEKLTSKNGLPKGNLGRQEFEDEGWQVMVTQSGIRIQSPSDEIITKLSDFKLNTSSSEDRHSMMTIDKKGRLVIVAGQVVLVDSELNKTLVPLKKPFKKTLEPVLGKYFIYKDSNYAHGVLEWPDGEQWFFHNAFVFRLKENDEPELLNERLRELCGEFIFRGSVYDSNNKGAWLLAGMGRLAFVPDAKDKAYLFNIAGDSPATFAETPYLGWDKDGNLWVNQGDKGTIRCITKQELASKLKTALPHQV